MKYSNVLTTLQNLIPYKISDSEIAECIGIRRETFSRKKKTDDDLTFEQVKKIEYKYGIKFDNKMLSTGNNQMLLFDNNNSNNNQRFIEILYRPDVYLSAGYGVEVYNEEAETMVLDERLFFTDKGLKINPKNCEIVTVSGNSMAPEYKHGDRVIIDKSVNYFIDGHVFAFRYNGECFIKEICLFGKRIKAIPLNKEYEPFFIEENEDVTVFGRILPRIRL